MLTSVILLWLLGAPTQAGSLLQRGLVALQHGQLSEARSLLEEASHMEPNNSYVWASLAETYSRSQEPEKASAAAATAEKNAPANPLAYHALAIYYAKAGDSAHAARLEEQYRAAAWEKNKTDPQIAFSYVQMLLQREDFSKAADVTTTTLQSAPNDAQLMLALGVERYGQRRFEDSVTTFLKVIRMDPTIEQPYLFLGKMLDQAGAHLPEITKADEAWVAADENNAKAKLVLAKSLLAQDPKSARAEDLLRSSIELSSSDWESHYQLGVLLEERRKFADAAAELNRSIELDAKQPLPHYHLARVYDRLGQADRAASERDLHQRLTAPKAP